MSDVIQIKDTGFIEITGKDAQKFFQGYTTCDLTKLTPDLAGLGATCNIQGRMIANYRIACTENGYLLRLPAGLVEPVMAFLKKYIVFSKAQLIDRSQTLKAFGVIGEMPSGPDQRFGCRTNEDGYTIRISGHACFEVWTGLNMMTNATIEQWQSLEIAEGIAWINTETTESYLPQMLNLHGLGGISFDKGCYLGQEIVARMQYRGGLSRKLFQGESLQPLKAGDALLATDGKTLGEVLAAEANQFLAVLQSKGDTPSAEDSAHRPVVLREAGQT